MNTEPPPPNDEPPLSPYEGGPLGAGIDWADPNSKLAPFYLTTGGVLAVAVLAITFLILGTAPLWHTDFWAHLRYGEWITANRALPDREPLCAFTDKQQPMFDALWLTQVGYAQVFRAGESLAGGDPLRRFAGGVELIRLIHLLAAVAAVGFVGLACRRVADSVPWCVLGMLMVLVLMLSPLRVQRPQAFALVCFAGLLCGLSRAVPSRAAVAWIPALLVLWANLHGSFVVGFGLVGAAFLGLVIDSARGEGGLRGAWRDLAARRLLLALVLGAIAVAGLTPHGPSIYLDVLRFGDHPNLRTLVEWQPLDFSQPRGGHWAYLATVVFLVVTQLVSPRPFGAFPLILILTLGLWPLFQQRAMAWWLPVVPWIAAPHWVAAAERWGFAALLSDCRACRQVRQARRGPPDFRRTAFSFVLLVLAVVVSPASLWLKTGRPRPVQASVHRGTPVDVAAALAGTPAPDAERVKELSRVVAEWHGGRYTGRVFASEVQGEYLLRALPADAEVMMFNHAQLFAAAYWNDCLAVKRGAGGWWEFLDRYRVGVVVVEADSHANLCAELRKHPAWAVVIDEANAPAFDRYGRLFVAVRKPGGSAP